MNKKLLNSAILVLASTLAILVHPEIVQSGGDPVVQITRVEIMGQSSVAELKVIYGSIDLQDLAVSDMDGDLTQMSEISRIVGAGETISLAWEKSNSAKPGSITVLGHVLASTDDQLVVYLDDEILDAVVWSNQDGTMAAAEVKDLQHLVDESEWSDIDQGNTVLVPESKIITRKGDKDTNSKQDWIESQANTDVEDNNEDDGSQSELPSAGMADILLLTATGAVFLSSIYSRIFPR